jgi:hypothetical protein
MSSVTREASVRSLPLALWPMERAVTAMAVALLGDWLLTLATPLPFALNAVAEWIMARTPTDLANTLLERLGTLARAAAVLGGFACYLLLAVVARLWDVALGRWVRVREAAPHALARVRTTSRIDPLEPTADGVLAAGVAYAGDRGISAVEVRADGGPWQPATLHAPLSGLTWVKWRALLPPSTRGNGAGG